MKSRKLGTTGITVPRAFLGCGTFGGIGGARHLVGRGLNRNAAFAVLDQALALGINVLDTAERYADGESESAIGEWLRQRPRKLTKAVRIATKVAPPTADGVDGTRFNRAYIERKLQTSLDRLGLERVTFYLSHAPDKTTPIEETVEGFAAVIDAGRVGHVGCCNVGAEELIEALDAAERLGVPGFEWVQNGFSLLSPNDDREVRAVCRERGLGYTPFSPLAGGILTGKYARGEPFPEGTRMALRPEAHAEMMTDTVTMSALWPKHSIWCWPRRNARRSLHGSRRRARRRCSCDRFQANWAGTPADRCWPSRVIRLSAARFTA